MVKTLLSVSSSLKNKYCWQRIAETSACVAVECDFIYDIQPNYHAMHLGFSILLWKLVVKYVSTYTKSTLKNYQRRIYRMILMQFFVGLFLIVFIKAYVVGTHYPHAF